MREGDSGELNVESNKLLTPFSLSRALLHDDITPQFLDMMTAKMSDKDSREDIQKVFNLFDDDQTGHITLRNLKRVAKELGETMSDAELLEMIERADTDQDGEISPEEFYSIMTKKTFT